MHTRRTFLTTSGALLAGHALRPTCSFAEEAKPSMIRPLPTPAQLAWQDHEIGLVYHFDMPIAAGNFADNNTARTVFDPKLYNPATLDTDQWVEAAKAAGAGYAVFTATHFNGFMQWQSDLYPYGVKEAAWRGGQGDVVADFVASCRRAGIKPGIYFSTHRNVHQTVWGHYVDWGKGKGSAKQVAYNKIAANQLEELCSRYGDLAQIWFDAGVKLPHEGGPDVLPVFAEHQPDSVFYHSSRRSDHRWVGNEAGKVRSLKALMDMYYQSAGLNCNLLLGEVVTSGGLVPEHDIRRLAEFGAEIKRRFGKSVAETKGTGHPVELKLPRPRRLNHMIAMEDIAKGERIRNYTLEGLVPGGEWATLCSGQCIGHKRIQTFAPVEVAAVRLRINKATGTPHIRRLAVFDVA